MGEHGLAGRHDGAVDGVLRVVAHVPGCTQIGSLSAGRSPSARRVPPKGARRARATPAAPGVGGTGTCAAMAVRCVHDRGTTSTSSYPPPPRATQRPALPWARSCRVSCARRCASTVIARWASGSCMWVSQPCWLTRTSGRRTARAADDRVERPQPRASPVPGGSATLATVPRGAAADVRRPAGAREQVLAALVERDRQHGGSRTSARRRRRGGRRCRRRRPAGRRGRAATGCRPRCRCRCRSRWRSRASRGGARRSSSRRARLPSPPGGRSPACPGRSAEASCIRGRPGRPRCRGRGAGRRIRVVRGAPHGLDVVAVVHGGEDVVVGDVQGTAARRGRAPRARAPAWW